jgi:hypothetical protein
MKKFFLILILISFGSYLALSQESVTVQKEEKKEVQKTEKEVQKVDKSIQKFIDKNGNGIDDRKEREFRGRGPGGFGPPDNKGKGPSQEMKKDLFIDEDGDGICDKRAKGMIPRMNNGFGPFGRGQKAAGRDK